LKRFNQRLQVNDKAGVIQVPGTNQKLELKLCQLDWSLNLGGREMTGCADKAQAFQGNTDAVKDNCEYTYVDGPMMQGIKQRNQVQDAKEG
jgi:hypothetical protein